MHRSFPQGRAWLLAAVVMAGPAAAQEAAAPAAEPAADAPPAEQAPEQPAPAPEAATESNATIPAPDALPAAAETIAVEAPAPKPVQPETPPSTDKDVIRIDDIVVTATKRQKSLRDIPESITAFSGEKLEDSGRINLIDYMAQTPGLTVNQAYPGLTRFTIRGISTETNPGSITPSPVGFFIGDTAFTDPYIASIIPDLSAFDLAGVQVLKGPQGTLFGGAALSGAIRYELQEPVQDQWQVRGFSQVVRPEEGSLAVTSGAAVNIPLWPSQSLAARVAYVRRNYPGVIDDTYNDQKDINKGSGGQYRALLLWEPGNWRLKLTHLKQDFKAADAYYFTDSVEGPRQASTQVVPSTASNKFGLDSFELGYNFDSFKLVSLTSYLYKDADQVSDATNALVGKPPQGYPHQLVATSPVFEYSKALSQEVRLQSTGDGSFDWLVGAYYYRYTMDFGLSADLNISQQLLGNQSALAQLAAQLGLPITLLTDNLILLNGTSHTESGEKALFADFSYKPWDSVELSAGARFYQTSVDGGFIGNGALLLVENYGMPVDSRAKISEQGINPKFTATWKFAEGKSLYGQVAKGFRFGGVQIAPHTATNGVPATFKSDTLWNYELGLRTSWLEHTLNADLTAFYITYKNPIIAQNTGGIPVGYSDNVSSAISRGLEASLLWYTPVPGLSLSLTGALTDAHITAPFTASDKSTVEAGQELPGAAPTQYNASLSYLRPVGSINVGANTGYNYVGQGYSDIIHSIEINGYGSWDAGLIFSSDAWDVHPKLALNVSNLLDKAVAIGGSTVKPLVPVVQPYNQYSLNPPRTVTIRLSLDF